MRKVIRSTYPAEFSLGLLFLIFAISGLLSHQIFDVPLHTIGDEENVYLGMFLVSAAVIIMVLIIWEEILFPIKVKEKNGGVVFKNHITKLKVQILIYSLIPAIFVFVYFEYEVNHIRFFIWAAVCMIPPVLEKLVSGINNHNDFLNLNKDKIAYKNNEKEGSYRISDILNISMLKDERDIIHKIELVLKTNDSVIIDLDEMELEDYYIYIEKFITSRYKHLLK